jgi:hypothetical protein
MARKKKRRPPPRDPNFERFLVLSNAIEDLYSELRVIDPDEIPPIRNLKRVPEILGTIDIVQASLRHYQGFLLTRLFRAIVEGKATRILLGAMARAMPLIWPYEAPGAARKIEKSAAQLHSAILEKVEKLFSIFIHLDITRELTLPPNLNDVPEMLGHARRAEGHLSWYFDRLAMWAFYGPDCLQGVMKKYVPPK